MAYWLVKSEPDAFSWDQQVANKVEPWTGVRNYQARRNMMDMRLGDRAFFYHSNIGKEIVGVVEIVREAYPDPTSGESASPESASAGSASAKSATKGGGWICVDVRAVGPMPRPVTLAAIKADPALADLALVRQSRLSVVPVSDAHWAHLCRMGGWTAG
ncbi:EVE domain-containing protein [Nguyenibacter vanlangensis]|uniref:EVE domain-containing protein n=1 Tax=Nguyenibacter vanlangensis TaxID=1216886 RepID=A0ABZ3D430_9PROT